MARAGVASAYIGWVAPNCKWLAHDAGGTVRSGYPPSYLGCLGWGGNPGRFN